ncbi:MAG TPA: lyase family protein [Gemmatimonadales bacterium]|nr:lyase family protein [Gemmatimonadales bacterium]
MTETLWSPGASPDEQMLAYTVGDDREIDTRLLRWDVLGSLGHLESLRGGEIITAREYTRMRRALRAAVHAVDTGALTIGSMHEDAHSAVEFWLTQHHGDVGTRVHAGRSRNDQVTLDLRLYLRHELLAVHVQLGALVDALLRFATKHRRVIWPGYTHQRIAMPSSAGAWAAGYAEQLLDTIEAFAGLWPRLDRSPLGSAAGYGAPLPLDREAAARALGFGGVDQVVTAVQNARGQLEAAALFWCLDGAHALAKLSADVILYSSDEFGWLTLPSALSTGSSIMPQKRNPDLFELTRARAAALEGDFHAVMALKRGLPGGYHRDFQLLKAPTLRGLTRTREMLGMLTTAVPALGVDARRAAAAMRPEIFATDEAMRRVRDGTPFRDAYRAVAATVKGGGDVPRLSSREILAHRASTGGLGNLGVPALRTRLRTAQRAAATRQRHLDRALARLIG